MQQPDSSLIDPDTRVQQADHPSDRSSAGRFAAPRESAARPNAGSPPPPRPPFALGGDILYGATVIAEFLFGDRKHRRKVFNLVETGRLPHFRLGATICARKSVLVAWIADQEGYDPRRTPKIPTT